MDLILERIGQEIGGLLCGLFCVSILIGPWVIGCLLHSSVVKQRERERQDLAKRIAAEMKRKDG